MISNNEDELNNIKMKIVKTQIIGAPGAILLGLGLYGMFGANDDAFHPLLNDKSIIVNSLLIVGVAIELWQLYVLIPLFKKQPKLRRLI
jgi:hypothetical protein